MVKKKNSDGHCKNDYSGNKEMKMVERMEPCE